MTAVFHAWTYDRFIEIQSNLRRTKLPRTKTGSDFLGGNFSKKYKEPQSNLEKKVNSNLLKNDYSSRTFSPSSPQYHHLLLDQSNKTSWVFSALKPNPALLIDQMQVQKPILVAPTNHMPDHNKLSIVILQLQLKSSLLEIILMVK